MTCRTCQSWAATSNRQWENRAIKLAQQPQAFVCPQCQTTDWVTTKAFILNEQAVHRYAIGLTVWAGLCLLVIIVVMTLVVRSARAELCLPKVDSTIEKRSGYRWQWRYIEGDPRKCWFYSNTLLPKEDLIWSYKSSDFDSDIDRVIERKFYFPELDENGLLRPRD